MGGLSPERDVSIVTGNSVIAAIKRKGLIALPIQVDHQIGETLQSNPIDLAFIALHGTFGEDGCIQGLLEYFKIPYTGSGVIGSALAYDKLKSKNWKYSEDKTGTMMEATYKKCEIEFLDQKRFPAKDKGKYNTPTKNIVKISTKEFENVPIHHTQIKHKTDIL